MRGILCLRIEVLKHALSGTSGGYIFIRLQPVLQGEVEFSCPKTGFVEPASTVTFLAPDGKNIVMKAALQGFNSDCSFKNKDTAEVALTLPFAARRGVAGMTLQNKELPYFVAVLSPEEKILQRQAFATTIDFDNTGNGSSTEEHVIKIPLTAPEDAYKYKVVIGFALTPDQLQYNKEKK